MPNNNFQINQTQFASQEPVLEGVAEVEQELNPEGQEAVIVTQKRSKKIILVGVVGFVLIVVFILLLILLRLNSDDQRRLEEAEEKVMVEQVGELNPLLREVYYLGVDLKAGDPVLNSVPFPPLDMELRLEEKKK